MRYNKDNRRKTRHTSGEIVADHLSTRGQKFLRRTYKTKAISAQNFQDPEMGGQTMDNSLHTFGAAVDPLERGEETALTPWQHLKVVNPVNFGHYFDSTFFFS